MFLLNGTPLGQDVPFTDAEGNQYPANWLRLSTPEEKASIGITEVADPVQLDGRFYHNGDPATPRTLSDLKPQYITQIKGISGAMLKESDWYIIRKVERNIDIPESIQTYRAAIIAESNRLETAINAAVTIDEFIGLVTNQNWPVL